MKRWRASELGAGRPEAPRGSPAAAAPRCPAHARRQRTCPALPGQVHERAGPRARHRARGRIHHARACGRPGPVGTRDVRRAAGHGHQGRRGGMERHRRRQRQRPRRRSPPATDRIGAPWARRRPLSTTFASQAAVDAGLGATLGTRRRLVAVRGTRGLTRSDMVANTAVPAIEVSPDDGSVELDGRALRCDPVPARAVVPALPVGVEPSPSSVDASKTTRPAAIVISTRVSPIAPARPVERVAVQHRQIGPCARFERARVVVVVDPCRSGGVRGDPGGEVDALTGVQRRGIGVARRLPGDRHLQGLPTGWASTPANRCRTPSPRRWRGCRRSGTAGLRARRPPAARRAPRCPGRAGPRTAACWRRPPALADAARRQGREAGCAPCGGGRRSAR